MKSTALMKKNSPSANSGSALRYGMFIPLALMIASVILNYKKWSAVIFYQTETEMLSGQMLTTRPSMAKVEVSYRPVQTMTFALSVSDVS